MTLTLGASLGLTAPHASGQGGIPSVDPVLLPAEIQEITLSLTPTLPNYTNSDTPTDTKLQQFRMTVGDLNADGIPDLVFSNALAFARVYWMGFGPNGGWRPASFYDLLPYGPDWPTQIPSCDVVGDDARYLSTSPWGIDTPLIHDIDLDGVNELIYLEHVSSPTDEGAAGLRVYDTVFNPATGQEELVPQSHAQATEIMNLHASRRSAVLPVSGRRCVAARPHGLRLRRSLPRQWHAERTGCTQAHRANHG